MIREENLVGIGKIFKPHGYKGEMNIEISLDGDIFDNPCTPFFVKMDNIPVPFFVESVGGGANGTSFLKFKGVDSDLKAAAFANKELYAEKETVASLYGVEPEDLIFNNSELVGYEVYDADTKETLGQITEVSEGVEYDYLVVKKKTEGREMMIPLLDEFIEEIIEPTDEGVGRFIVRLPEGFMEI